MGNFTASGVFERDADGLSPSADTKIIRATERERHEGKNGVNEPLSGTQCEAKDAFEHQNGENGQRRITLRMPPGRGFGFVVPALDGQFIQPEVSEP